MKEKLIVEAFSERLRYIVATRQISRKRLAELGGVSNVSISKYLNGQTSPSQPALTKWVQAFGIDGNWLLTGLGSPFLEENAGAPSPGVNFPKMDLEVLSAVVETLEEVLEALCKELLPETKARVVCKLYEYFIDKEPGERRPATILKYIRSAEEAGKEQNLS